MSASLIGRLGSEADIQPCLNDVRFTPQSEHREMLLGCPVCAISGHPSLDYFVGERPGNEQL